MNTAAATRKGIDFAFSSVRVLVAELAWRWAFAAGCVGILLFYSTPVRDALSLSATDQSIIAAGSARQSAQTVAMVLLRAAPIIASTLYSAVPLIALLWCICISFGRIPVMRAVTSSCGRAASGSYSAVASMFVLHLIRLLLILILISGYLAGGMLASYVAGPQEKSRISAAIVVFLAVMAVSLAIWSVTNAIVSLAPVFLFSAGRSALDAIVDAMHATQRHWRDLFSAAASNGTLRTLITLVVTLLGLCLVPLARVASPTVILFLGVLLTAIYCVGSDLLLIARLATYAYLVLPQAVSAAPDQTPESALYTAPPDLRT